MRRMRKQTVPSRVFLLLPVALPGDVLGKRHRHLEVTAPLRPPWRAQTSAPVQLLHFDEKRMRHSEGSRGPIFPLPSAKDVHQQPENLSGAESLDNRRPCPHATLPLPMWTTHHARLANDADEHTPIFRELLHAELTRTQSNTAHGRGHKRYF